MSPDAGYEATRRLRFRDHHDDLRAIATELRKLAREYPKPSEDPRCSGLFLVNLALMIDPTVPPSRMSPKLVVKHGKAGSPEKKPSDHDGRIGLFMWAYVDVLGEKYEATVDEAANVFGVGKTRATAALVVYRCFIQENGIYQEMADRVLALEQEGCLRERLAP